MKHFALIVFVFSVFSAKGQKHPVDITLYLSPALVSSPIQTRILKDGQVTSENMRKKTGLFWGAGIEIMKKVPNNFRVGGELAFISKGALEYTILSYQQGSSLAGTDFTRYDLNYLETTALVEKQFRSEVKKRIWAISSGLFYGMHLRPMVSFGLKANGSDVGFSVGGSYNKKRFVTKLEFKKGVVDIKNNAGAHFKTSVFALKFGWLVTN